MVGYAMETEISYPEISVKPSQLQRQMGNVKRPERFMSQVDRVLREASQLWTPKICWARRGIEILPDGRSVKILNDVGITLGTLKIGERTNLLNGAKECFISVATVGRELSARILELERDGDVVAAYLMDIVGVLALNETHRHFRDHVTAHAALEEWGVGPVMQPGSLDGWDLEGQADLLRLLPVDKIGVTLNNYFMMEPAKSNSTLVAIGPGYDRQKPECLCEDCSRYDCPWRRTRDYE